MEQQFEQQAVRNVLPDEIKEKLIELFSEYSEYDDDKREYYSKDRQEETVHHLKNLHKKIADSQNFNIGDIVHWKQGLRNKKRPYPHEPAIVIDILDPPVSDETQNSGSSYFREPLDMVIGIADYNMKGNEKNDDPVSLLFFHVDKRRFESLPLRQ